MGISFKVTRKDGTVVRRRTLESILESRVDGLVESRDDDFKGCRGRRAEKVWDVIGVAVNGEIFVGAEYVAACEIVRTWGSGYGSLQKFTQITVMEGKDAAFPRKHVGLTNVLSTAKRLGLVVDKSEKLVAAEKKKFGVSSEYYKAIESIPYHYSVTPLGSVVMS